MGPLSVFVTFGVALVSAQENATCGQIKSVYEGASCCGAADSVALGTAWWNTNPNPTSLDTIKARGRIVVGKTIEYTTNRTDGIAGFHHDFARAYATAIFGDTERVDQVETVGSWPSSTERFNAVASGDVDVLVGGTTQTFERQMMFGGLFQFSPVYTYDGAAFMAAFIVSQPSDLIGKHICGDKSGTSASSVSNYLGVLLDEHPDIFPEDPMSYQGVTYTKCKYMLIAHPMVVAYIGDRSVLESSRVSYAEDVNRTLYVSPNVPISRDPLAAVVARDHGVWSVIVEFVHQSMIVMAEHGVTSANVDDVGTLPGGVRSLLGDTTWTEAHPGVSTGRQYATLQESIGLDRMAIYRVIKHIGNANEAYKRNFLDPEYASTAGANALVRDGGLLYPLPVFSGSGSPPPSASVTCAHPKAVYQEADCCGRSDATSANATWDELSPVPLRLPHILQRGRVIFGSATSDAGTIGDALYHRHYMRAVATALFRDPTKYEVVETSTEWNAPNEGMTLLSLGTIDVLVGERVTLEGKILHPHLHYGTPFRYDDDGPYAMVTQRDPSNWFLVVEFVQYGMLELAYQGITSTSVDALDMTKIPRSIRVLLGNSTWGGEHPYGSAVGFYSSRFGFTEDSYTTVQEELGLRADSIHLVVRTVGNAEEAIQSSYLDTGVLDSPGLNALTNKGGIMFPVPYGV